MSLRAPYDCRPPFLFPQVSSHPLRFTAGTVQYPTRRSLSVGAQAGVHNRRHRFKRPLSYNILDEVAVAAHDGWVDIEIAVSDSVLSHRAEEHHAVDTGHERHYPRSESSSLGIRLGIERFHSAFEFLDQSKERCPRRQSESLHPFAISISVRIQLFHPRLLQRRAKKRCGQTHGEAAGTRSLLGECICPALSSPRAYRNNNTIFEETLQFLANFGRHHLPHT